jgi:hypothetical protein
MLRTAALFVLFSVIVSSHTSAAELRGGDRISSETTAFAAFVRTLPEPVGVLLNLWANEGSSLDPFGNPKPSSVLSSPASADEGSSLDPSGR